MSTKYIDNGSYAVSGYTISGANSSIVVGAAGSIGGSGISSASKESYSITNNGRITGTYAGVALYKSGSVNNTGLIASTATSGTAVILYGGGSLTNASTGTIIGADGVILEGLGVISNAGTIIGNGKITNSNTYGYVGLALYRGGRVTNTAGALIKASSGLFLSYATSSAVAGIISNAGTVDSTAAGGSLAVGVFLGLGSLTNTGTAALIEGHIGVELVGAGTVTNGGTIASTAGSAGVAVEFLTAGDVLVADAGAHFVGKVIGDNGTLELAKASGTLSGLGGSFTGFRLVDVLAGAKWTLGGTDLVASGTTSQVVDSGFLLLSGTSTVAGTISGTGTLALAGGQTALDTGTALTVSHLAQSAGTTTLGVSLAYANGFSESGGVVALGGKVLTLSGAASFTGGTIMGAGSLATTDAVSLAGLTLDGGAVWQQSGTVTETGSLTLGRAGSGNGGGARLNVAAGAVFDITGTGGIGGTQNTIVNQGLIEKTDGTGTSTIAGNLTDTGTLTIATGTLDVTGTDALDGKITGSGTLDIAGGSATLEGGAVMDVTHLKLSGGTLKLSGYDLLYAGGFAMSGGTFSLTDYVVQLSGANVLSGGTITADGGGFSTYGTATTLGALTLGSDALLQDFGTIKASGALTFGDGALRLTVEDGAIYDITGYKGVALGTNGTGLIDNAGLLEKTVVGAVTVIAPRIIDTGTIVAATGTLEFTAAGDSFQGSIGGAGTVEFAAGNDTLTGNAKLGVAHLLLAGTGTELIVDVAIIYAGGFTQSAGTLVDASSLTLSGVSSLSGAVSGGGTLKLAGTATLNSGASLGVSHLAVSAGKTTVKVSLSYAGGFAISGGTLAVASDTLSLTGAASFTGGAVSGAGTLATHGAVSLTALTLAAGAVWQVYGTVTDTGALTLGSAGGGAGHLTVLAGGVFDITANGGIAIASGGTAGISDAGVFEKTAGTGTSTIAPLVTNTGTILVTAGTLDLHGGVTGAGHETIGTSGTLKADGTVAAGQTISFAGTAGGSLVLSDPVGTGLGFAGTISGFGGSDRLDLTSFADSGKPKLAWSQTSASSGTLTVTDGKDIAKITLFGQYALAGFKTAKDAGTGTVITYTAPAKQVALANPHH